MTTTKIWSHINVGDLCVHCGRNTALGHSDMLFVDRIPADADLLDNECPFEWDVDEDSSTIKTVTLIFSIKEWEDSK